VITFVDAMRVSTDDDPMDMARHAADAAVTALTDALGARGEATAMFATGNSQVQFLADLVTRPGIDWTRVTAFHLDEYVAISSDHPASLRRYLRAHIADRIPLRAFHFITGDAANPEGEAARYAELLATNAIDLCCVGIGENGHLAFNDPPGVRFDDPALVKVVELAEASRNQQVGEGHFARLSDVPTHAITVTIPQILDAATVLAVVPERRKAAAVHAALMEPVTPDCPASILRSQPHAQMFLDRAAATTLLA
jgi:glucosamine-6-phosphate deaminase